MSDPSTVVSQALAKARATTSYTVGRCLQFVAGAYGDASGFDTASDAWAGIPAQYKHTDGSTPPPGAWVFYADNNPSGHVALSEGGGMEESTDFSNGHYQPGSVGAGTISQVGQAMGGRLLGWTSPYVAGQGPIAGDLQSDGTSTSSGSTAAPSTGTPTVQAAGLFSALSPSTWEDLALKVLFAGAGAALVIGGLAITAKDTGAVPNVVPIPV